MSRARDRRRARRAIAQVCGGEVCPDVLRVQGQLRALARELGAPVLVELAEDLDATRQTTARMRIALEGLLLTEAGHDCPCDGEPHHRRCYVARLRDRLSVGGVQLPGQRLALDIAAAVADLTPTTADDLVVRVLAVLRDWRSRRNLEEDK